MIHAGTDQHPQGHIADGLSNARYSEPTDDTTPLPTKDAAAPQFTPDGCVILSNGTVVHPQTEKFFQMCPWMRKVPVFGPAIEGFGPVFIVSLSASYFLLKGVADQIIGFSRQPMMTKRFGLSGQRYQRLASLYAMGWSIKAFTAMFTDTFALFGYTKRWYMFGSCVAGAAFALGYGLLPAKQSSGDIAAAFIFLTCLGKANVDILSEGHYSRLIRRNPVPGPALVSCIWICILTGTLVASVIQGPLSDNNKMQVGVFVSAALQVLCSIFFVFNWYGEKTNKLERLQDLHDMKAALAKTLEEQRLNRDGQQPQSQHQHGGDGNVVSSSGSDVNGEGFVEVPVKENLAAIEAAIVQEDLFLTDGLPEDHAGALVQSHDDDDDDRAAQDELAELNIKTCLFGAFEINKEVVTRNWKVLIYCVVMTCSVVAMVCVTILGTTYDLMYACIVLSVVNIVCAFLTLPLVIAKANVFTYLYFVLYVQLPGALDSFYLADATCLPNGPHFDYTFYNTVGAVIQNIGGIIGVTLFTYVFSKMNYQVTMGVSVLLMVIASLFDLIMVERWNIDIGIPDHAMYIMGDAVIYQICYMFSYMPIVMLMSRLCPRGSESMIFALMAGFANLGSSMSTTIGSLLVEFRFPFVTTPPCDFSNVRWLIIIGHLGMPLVIVPLSFLLLPRVRICDDIDVNGELVEQHVKKSNEEAARHATAEREPNAEVSSASQNK